MIDKRFIIEKVNLISRDLERLKIFSSFDIHQISQDFIKFAALKNILMEIIGRAIDINEHIISEEATPDLDIPKTYRETFLLLPSLKVLPKDFAQEIAKSAGLRNIIVHEYNDLEKAFVYNTIGELIKQYSQYCGYLLKYLDQLKD